MVDKLIIENPNTFAATLGAGISLFLGSGFSLLAVDGENRILPLGGGLADELRGQFNIDKNRNLPLASLCTLIEQTNKDKLVAYLKERLSVSKYDERYHALEKLNIETIFTTNVDNLVHKIFEESRSKYINDVNMRGPVFRDRDAIDLVTLHGSILDDSRPLRFGVLDMASALSSDPARWYFLQTRLQQSPTIVWGYAMEDATTLQMVAGLRSQGDHTKDAWILVRPTTPPEQQAFYRALDFHIIEGTTESLLDYLEKITPGIGSPANLSLTTHDLFPNESIPSLGSIPIRPISQFFEGAPPTWSDIYSRSLHKTKHYQRVRDAVYSGRNVLIVGGTASGKTTLLMQIAADFEFSGHKLIMNTTSQDKAILATRKLAGESALIFLDDFTNDARVLTTLQECPNIQVIAADRDYNFGLILHLIDEKNYVVLDVTELEREDIVACIGTIPSDIRRLSVNVPKVEMSRGIAPSLFEIIESNLKFPTLKRRFVSVIDQLDRNSPNLAELLLMISYVHSCRTPVSLDMMIGYWRGRTNGYEEIYEMRQQIGTIVADYYGDLADDEQDYYAARSTLAAETVLSVAYSDKIKEMLQHFHTNLSIDRICHYDIFKRRAYDHKIVAQAFVLWEEGKAFYEKLYQRDPSFYNLQHAALYLSQMRQHSEAGLLIDRALNTGGSESWSVRNSYAIIIFKANIDFAHNNRDSRVTLDQSMEILTECYTWDKRKPFHAKIYADQALKYYQVFKDNQSIRYLETSAAWLQEEISKYPWDQALKRLKREIDTYLHRHKRP